MATRTRAWLGVLLLAALAAFGYGQVADTFGAHGSARVGLSSALGLLGILSVLLFPHLQTRRSTLLAVWLPAIVLRVLLLPTAPSDDVNRYLWEGKLVRAGISPYAQTADAESWTQHRDSYWAAMNHRDQATAYPPLSELAFAVIGAAAYHPLAYKITFLLADLLTLAGLCALLQRRGLKLAFAGFYALSPISLLAYAGEGHFDSMMVAALVGALWACESGRPRWAMGLAAVATGIKWIALPLLPFFLGKRGWANGLIAAAVLLLPALFFWSSLSQLVDGLLAFGGSRSFNGPIYGLLLAAGLSRSLCSGMVVLCLGAILLWRWWGRERAALDAHLRWILGGLILLSPTVHFWYLAWLLPFVCLRPTLPWLTLSVTSGVYFCVWSNAGWGLSLTQQCFFWGPFALAVLYELWSTQGRCVLPLQRAMSCDDSVSVVIPSYNAAAHLPQALQSIRQQSARVAEVIVVDAGSVDASVALASAADMGPVLQCELGRGQQIATGIAAARSEWVIVLHADAELAPETVASLQRAARSFPNMLGGAMGQQFRGRHVSLLLIEVLNEIRALWSRTAFGDQVQFFHRSTAVRYGLMPRQALMEDVESSWRLRELGEFIYLGQPCRVSYSKWEPLQWFRRFTLVMRLISRYRWARLQGRAQAEALSIQLYQEYYGTQK
ncbi:MAG: hypothetical protein ACI81V_000268 [Lentimonas sp.]|jgi:hypothetical protein